ncbi:Hint domain-containing protein [Gluconobacter frateurii]|uniref:Hint domain-containing protein n=1 Tax=Gluconobacter frateurii TaxID=38308 RepID=UPI001F05E0AC|nr:Hint domain-containing protein [Gluconobacter frateurii]UMM09435.1 Hint domain-containing protein [Gluconobacter frateurii]
MSASSTYTSPETGKTYTVVSGGVVSGKDLNGTVQTIQSGTAVSGTQVFAGGAVQFMVPPANIREQVGFPVSQVVTSDAASIDSVISGITTLVGPSTMSDDTWTPIPATQIIESGGFASNTYLGPATTSIINNGGISDNVTIMGASLRSGDPMMIPGFNTLFSATQIVSSGGILHTATLGSSGTLILNGGSADHITVGTGTVLQKTGTLSDVLVNQGGVLSVSADQNAENVVTSGGVIILDRNANLTGTFQEMYQTTISLTDLGNNPSAVSGVIVKDNTTAGSVLEVVSSGAIMNRISVKDGFSSPYYFKSAPSGQGIDLMIGTPCYCPGTLIATPDGERPVEKLMIGDNVLTATGETRPIRWIGRRSYDPMFAYGNRDILPIVFQKGSLGNQLPRRDLTVSPLHAMFVDGYLIPALHLVNGLSIIQIEKPSHISYIHIELETHDILLAEGAPSESFLDDSSRGMFHNAHEYSELYPDAPGVPVQYCAPRLEDGEELARIHQRLKDYAQQALSEKAA